MQLPVGEVGSQHSPQEGKGSSFTMAGSSAAAAAAGEGRKVTEGMKRDEEAGIPPLGC